MSTKGKGNIKGKTVGLPLKVKKMKAIFLGVQGSGKSTQAKQLAKYLNIPYVEMGQLLRDKSQGASDQAKQIKDTLSAGNLVKNQITIDILRDRISKDDCQKGFILDGYPRNKQQLQNMPSGVDKVFFINVPDEEANRRLLVRGRHDDTRQFIKRRIELFHKETKSIIDHFRNLGILIEIDGLPSIEQIHKDIITKIKNEPN